MEHPWYVIFRPCRIFSLIQLCRWPWSLVNFWDDTWMTLSWICPSVGTTASSSLKIVYGKHYLLLVTRCTMRMIEPCRSCYVAVVLYVVGMVLMGAAFQNHLTIAAFIIGWGLVEIATMVNTVAICKWQTFRPFATYIWLVDATDAYLNDSFPKFQVCFAR